MLDKVINIENGNEIENNLKKLRATGHGCGTMSASNSAYFFRGNNPTIFDIETKKHEYLTNSTRPGCWINIIPAGGLILMPEASSGCTCSYAIQASLALAPIEKNKKKQIMNYLIFQ